MKSPQLVSDVEERKVITSWERRVVGYFGPAVIRSGDRLVLSRAAIRAGSASASREGHKEEKRDED